MKKCGVIILLVTAIAAAFGAIKYQNDHKFDEIKSGVAIYFKDPSSARFRGLVQSGGFICGDVNAKNDTGEYGGFARFYIEPGAIIRIEKRFGYERDESLANFQEDVWDKNCKEDFLYELSKYEFFGILAM